MKVFLSGVAGFLGTKIAERLLKRSQVVALDNFLYDNQASIFHLLGNKNFEFHQGSVEDKDLVKDLVKDCDVVIPLAAIVGAPICDRMPDVAKRTNEDSVKFLMSLLGKSQRVIFPQTNSGYGIGGKAKCVETDELNPISLYGVTKCRAEDAVVSHGNSVSVRLATVYGASARNRFDLMVNFFVSELFYNGEITIFEPEFRRNFVHIRDVARVFEFFCFNDLKGIYNVGNDDDNLTKRKLAELVAKELYNDISRIKIGKGEDIDKRDYEVSSEKIRNAGFDFQYNLKEGIREVAKLCSMIKKEDIKNMKNY